MTRPTKTSASDPQRQSLDRRKFLKQVAAGASVAAMAGAKPNRAASAEEKPQQPNILFFFSDQQRWDSVDCYGRPLFEGLTPNLDRMAAEGVKFQHAFTCQPVCGPARSCLQTGKWATETGCFRNNIKLPLDEVTIADRLSDAGYEVGYIGKWHLASSPGENFRTEPVPPERRGGYKDYWLAADVLEFTSHSYDGYMYDGDMNKVVFPEGRYRVDTETDYVIDYLRTRKGDRPFFLFLSYLEPHHQNDHGHFEGPKGSKEKFKDFNVPGDLKGTGGDWKEEMPDYLGCINSLDANLGRIRAELERLGIADNTLIICTSDHGCHFRTRNGEYKRSCHDDCTRVPMILYGPGFRGGKTVDELVSLIDLPPTLMRAGGVEPPDSMGGHALQPLAAGKADDWRDEVFMQISESQVGRAIRTRRWKYSVRAPNKNGGRDMNSDVYVEDFLYDLDADPNERNNLVADAKYADVRARLAETLKRRMKMAGEEVPEIRPHEQ
jgi:uncharacterized sulfatase